MLRTALLAFAVASALFVTDATSDSAAVARFNIVQQSFSTFGEFPGATSTWRTALTLRNTNKVIGNGVAVCIQIDDRLLRHCEVSYRFPNGQLELAGMLSTRSRYQFLVVGAVGVYAGQSGSAVINQIGSNPWTGSLTIYLS